MPIMSRPAPVAVPAREASPGQHHVTRPGVAPRVAPGTAAEQTHPGHSIGCMDQPQLDLIASTPPLIDAASRPWVYEQVLVLVAQGRVWIDNRNRRWIYGGGDTPADRMPDRQQNVLAELYAEGLITINRTRLDMPAPDCRTLRVRCYEPTERGTELHNRWVALKTSTR